MVLTRAGESRQTIFYAGVFDYDGLIKMIANWYNEFGFKFHENTLKHKVPSPDGSEQEIELSGYKKITEYVKYWIKIDGHIWELNEVEVKVGNEIKKMAKGKIKLDLSTQTDLDYNDKFKSYTARKLQIFLHQHIWYKKISGGWTDENYYLMWKLHAEIKKFLKMSTPHNASDLRY
jgi:hypothetical protein